ncbi:polysaccharide deacetylase family protein [Sphingobium sp. HBC34]|uniref:Polysaccharide deacetylase family protein n=1 Tax=Sphingobium cyanobacteriorum TaxID=3063954 RepID=A0ABT8ZM07_9SPHN|nr:polysaccharide deacetylase family protein [Sphingobium sp. HBC34]MDO7835579.1 polysaccharide deacetylase family protein [Sphingobium sp. HBC34]
MRRLLLSVHDVGPRFEPEIDLLLDRLSAHVELHAMAMLVVPDHWGLHPLVAGSRFASRLRSWTESGVSMFVHGWFHQDRAVHTHAMTRLKARHMTAGEGEFLGLDSATAMRRMTEGRDLIEQITGRPVAGFVAPAWLYGAPAIEALGACGFALAEDHLKVWHPPSRRVLARGPVITWASRSPMRIASSLMAAQLLLSLSRYAPVARVAVHPGDAHVPALLASIDQVLRRLGRTHRPVRYGDLLAD